MKQHLLILEMAAQGKLPETIDSGSDLSVTLVKELIDAGYLKAIDASSFDGVAYIEPKITLAGREYLDELRARIEENRMEVEKQNGRPLDVAPSNFDVTDAWQKIREEYGVSKSAFGRRINFVKDQFKRDTIFRDIGQGFMLADHGYNKPAVVLAGGVIEELLRLYLEQKGITPARNGLDSYIKACDENQLLKGPIHSLADSVRQFRNIVHLEKESSSRHTISKATAKGAVASIFTIANDFEAGT